MALTKASYSMIDGACFNILDFGADATGVADSAPAINAAIVAANAAGGGAVYVPTGTFRCLSQIAIPYQGIQLFGNGQYGSLINAVHTGAAIINMKGGVHCTVTGLSLASDSVTYPKTGILLGRSSANGAGYHVISNISMEAYVTNAGIYSIASEENSFSDIRLRMLSGVYGFYTSASDDLAIDSLTTSTNTVNLVQRVSVWMNHAYAAGDTPLYMNLASTKFWTFDTCYFTPNGNYYIVFNADASVDANLVFTNTNGEATDTATSYGGIKFQSANTTEKTVSRIKFLDTTFDLIAAGQFSVYVTPASKIILSDFEYQDYRISGAANAHNHSYYGLIDSLVGSADGTFEISDYCWNNTIVADIRNNTVRATSAVRENISGNTITQYSFVGMSNQGTTTQTSGSGPMVVIPKTDNASMPIQRQPDAAEILPSNVVFTNAGASGALNFELPKATLGNRVMVVKVPSFDIRIGVLSGSGDLIYNTSIVGFLYFKNTTAAQGYAYIELLCVSAGSWMALGSSGTWFLTDTP
jgi:hypothetical protein